MDQPRLRRHPPGLRLQGDRGDRPRELRQGGDGGLPHRAGPVLRRTALRRGSPEAGGLHTGRLRIIRRRHHLQQDPPGLRPQVRQGGEGVRQGQPADALLRPGRPVRTCRAHGHQHGHHDHRPAEAPARLQRGAHRRPALPLGRERPEARGREGLGGQGRAGARRALPLLQGGGPVPRAEADGRGDRGHRAEARAHEPGGALRLPHEAPRHQGLGERPGGARPGQGPGRRVHPRMEGGGWALHKEDLRPRRGQAYTGPGGLRSGRIPQAGAQGHQRP